MPAVHMPFASPKYRVLQPRSRRLKPFMGKIFLKRKKLYISLQRHAVIQKAYVHPSPKVI